ncbi:DEAD/DEAH box helicase family protein [Tetragenococcus halophilus]|nr:DEAD/DEAH box helicase family protein [Tetragenococcus halophilus]
MYKLRKYQQNLVNEARLYIGKGFKGVFIQSPPGSGKSVVIAEIVRSAVNNKKGHVLFIAHRQELLKNIEDSFKENDVDLSKVTIMSPQRIKNRLGKLPKPTLIITDEGHHGKAKTYHDIYEYYKDVPRLGFSATPWRMNGEGFEDIYEQMVEGPSIKWLIDNKNLAPFKWYGIQTVDRSKVDFKNLSREAKTSAELFNDNDAKIQGDIIEHYRKYADGKQAIVYAPTVEVSQMIAEWFNQADIPAIHCDGKTNKNERKKIMQNFKDKKFKILCNVDLISEGFDAPNVSVIILCRPTKSIVLHLQQSMRGMRYQPGKTSIILDHVGNGLNLGLPTSDFEWSLKGKSKETREEGPPCIECPSCGQVIEKSEIINDKCPACGAILLEEQKENDDEKNLYDSKPELFEITEEDILATKKYAVRQSLAYNYKIAKTKAEKKGGNPLFKLFGGLTIHRKQGFDEEELETFALSEGLDLQQVLRAYRWALNKSNEQQKETTNTWQDAVFN